jgi:hypothetical protein
MTVFASNQENTFMRASFLLFVWVCFLIDYVLRLLFFFPSSFFIFDFHYFQLFNIDFSSSLQKIEKSAARAEPPEAIRQKTAIELGAQAARAAHPHRQSSETAAACRAKAVE